MSNDSAVIEFKGDFTHQKLVELAKEIGILQAKYELEKILAFGLCCNKNKEEILNKEEKYDKDYFIRNSYIFGFMDGYNSGLLGTIPRSEALEYAQKGAEEFLKCQSPTEPLRKPIDVK